MSLLTGVCVLAAVLSWPAGRTERAIRARAARDQLLPGSSWRRWRARLTSAGRRLGLVGRGSVSESARWLPLLDQLSASLRVGLPPAEALSLALRGSEEHVRQRLAVVVDAAREGRACGPAWLRAARSARSAELELLARSWLISERLGAPLADAVDSAGRALRSGRDLASRLETATVGARTTATILTLLPVAGIGIALLMGITPTQLYGTPVALVSLAVGAGVIVVGRLIVSRMITKVVHQQ
ncbi:type II secretion system F family protein [Ornithinimicrobium faecis]|uniref:Type II secretion system F family protein n=1 Tax=Ornithinimicrobium faecis TaxID=2934158 RepID=A0ABY4YS89_9MICO|nr:type II secretion system F family protein [Ornithinimicrobium sp. HY1793]USQ79630.1 type II secretion system F family protein [Ornithinimicrobium sp. HY1793]